jgi:hypothetical protein
MYGYRYLADDRLIFQYWNADAGVWNDWGEPVPGNNTTATDNFCTMPRTLYTTPALNIAGFTATQLAGFRYRISYDDNPNGTDWNYGFCFESPTIVSIACFAPSSVVANVNGTSADVAWDGAAANYEYAFNQSATAPDSGTVTTDTTFSIADLNYATTYYFHVRSVCGDDAVSTWTTVQVRTGVANDDCETAIPAQVNPDYSCGILTSGTLLGAIPSNVPDNGAGTPDDDVWFSFVATNPSHRISLTNVTGTPTDLVHEIMTGGCGNLTSVAVSDPNISNVNNLVPGNTYYVRVFSWGQNTSATTSFDLCIGTPPPPPANDDCENSIEVAVNPGLQCVATVNGTLASATQSNVPDNGPGTPNDDVWYHFVATSTSHTITLSNVQGSITDLGHEVLSGSCASFTSLLISDPNNSTVTNLTIGNTYYIRVFSWGTAQSTDTTFTLCVGTPPTMTNDECFTAIEAVVNPDLNCAAVTPGTVLGATASNVPDNGAGTPNDDVWFSFVATAVSHKFELLNVSGSTTDMVHEIMSGDCESLVSMNVSDPNNSTVSGFIPGETYYVRVFTWGTSTTATTIFNLCIGTMPPPPANDECVNAIALTPAATYAQSAIDGTVASATASPEIPAPGCASYSGGDVWYTATIPTSGNLTIETGASLAGVTGFDSGIAVYAGECGNLTLVECDDDDADTGNYSRIVLTGRTPGEVVYVRVWEYGNDNTAPFSVGAYDASLSAPSFDKAGFSVYPNPVSDILNLTAQMNIETIEVFNLVGQQVFAKTINQTDYALDMSQLPGGTYIVRATSNGASKTVKVLKK